MNFKLEFTEAELSVVFNALAQRPFAEVAQLVAKIQQEVQSQATTKEGE